MSIVANLPTKNRIVIVAGTVRPGGAERVLSYLANHWAKGRAVLVVTFDDAGLRPSFGLDPRVELLALGAPRRPIHARSPMSVFSALSQILRLRRALRDTRGRNDGMVSVVSVCTYYNLVALLASLGGGFRRVVTEHSPPEVDSPVLRFLRRFLYRLADRVVVLTESNRRALPRGLRDRTIVIPNPAVDLTASAVRPGPGAERPFVLGAGRLVREKRFDLLIAAFARVRDDFPDWDLKIAGAGPLAGSLQADIDRAGLAGRASLLGFRSDLPALYAGASLFVLSSESEGFPMALCEAMAAGLPVIAADCATGPGDIVRDGVDGRLVPARDAAALAAAMRDLMGDAALRRRLGAAAAAVTRRFSPDRFFASWQGIVA